MGYYGHSALRCDGSCMLMVASLAHALLACLQAPGGMGRHLVYGLDRIGDSHSCHGKVLEWYMYTIHGRPDRGHW